MGVLLGQEGGLQTAEAQAGLSPCSSGRRRSGGGLNSPDFEFWGMMGNPNSFAESNLLSADELFSDGVMLPLDQLHVSSEPDGNPGPEPRRPGPEPEANGCDELRSAAAAPALTSSKRWRDMITFIRKGEAKESAEKNGLSGVKESKKRESKKSANGGGAGKVTAAELNINIWPFSRSRSAGNGGARPRAAAAGGCGRKVSSAPCSRSNSGGESKTRKWPSSPGRMNAGGVHLGRTSPVWQVRRGRGAAAASHVQNGGEKGLKKDGGVEVRRKVTSAAGTGKRVLSLNVPMCMGYSKSHLMNCKSYQNGAASVPVSAMGSGGGGGVVAGEGVRGSNMFGIRSLFTKKVY